MAIVTKHTTKYSSFIQITTCSSSLLFDFEVDLYGLNHRFPSADCPPKKLCFVAKALPPTDALFITGSESIGPLLLDGKHSVYCSKPVLEQLVLKYEEMLGYSLTYDDPSEELAAGHKLVAIDEINIDLFRERVTLLSYNQDFYFDKYRVIPQSTGTFIGWCNYLLVFPTGESLYFLSNYNSKKRFSRKATEIKSEYLIFKNDDHYSNTTTELESSEIKSDITINPNDSSNEISKKRRLDEDEYENKRLESTGDSSLVLDPLDLLTFASRNNATISKSTFNIANNQERNTLTKELKSFETIGEFNDFLKETFCSADSVEPCALVLPLDMCTFFIEIFFHFMSVLGNSSVNITVISGIFNKLKVQLNIQSEWLNNEMCMLGEPFPFGQSANLAVYENFNELLEQGGGDCHQVIFVDEFSYNLFDGRQLFSRQETVRLGRALKEHEKAFNIKIEDSVEEITSRYGGIVLNNEHLFIKSEEESLHIKVNGNLEMYDESTVLLNGILKHTDQNSRGICKLELEDKELIFSKMLREEKYVYIDGWTVFLDKRIKIRIKENKKIEYMKY
ncbi:hypothetical protein ENBRE01_1193 [Enteropsectra breve]|nr:hypothetical protein ENBRE01_1193 [Enteropsectra breve]